MSTQQNTYKKNPMTDLLGLVPLLKGCDPTKNPTNCFCTDPSFRYDTACTISSETGPNSNKLGKCYYGPPPLPENAGIVRSTGGSLANKAKNFTVKPGNANRIAFTNGTKTIQSGLTDYPTSLLFCADPGGNSTALPTSSTPNLGYDGDRFSNWSTSQVGSGNKTPNIGFA